MGQLPRLTVRGTYFNNYHYSFINVLHIMTDVRVLTPTLGCTIYLAIKVPQVKTLQAGLLLLIACVIFVIVTGEFNLHHAKFLVLLQLLLQFRYWSEEPLFNTHDAELL